MVGFYPLCAFGENRVAASIDTPLHAFLPFDARRSPASRTGRSRWRRAPTARRSSRSSTRGTAGSIIWVPWQRPGFELALMLQRAVEADARLRRHHPRRPRAVHVGRHAAGVLSRTASAPSTRWASSSRSTATRSGAAALRRRQRSTGDGPIASRSSPSCCRTCAARCRRTGASIAHFDGVGRRARRSPTRAGPKSCARWARAVPDHFLRTRISPMFMPWDPATEDSTQLEQRIGERVEQYREDYAAYYQRVRRAGLAGAARPQSVGRRHSRARAVRLRQGQARGAHHDRVLRQRHPRDGGRERARGRTAAPPGRCRRSRRPEQASEFKTLPQLRRAAAARGVPHRVLGARGGQAAADAAGAGVQPARSRSWSAAAAASAARSRCRSPSAAAHVVVADANVARRRGGRARSARRCRPPRWSMSARAGSDRRARRSPRRCAQTVLSVRRRRHRRQHRGDLPDARIRRRRPKTVWAQTLQINVTGELRAGAGGGEGAEGAEPAGGDRAHELGERRRAEGRQRAVRRQQGGDQPPRFASWRSASARWSA